MHSVSVGMIFFTPVAIFFVLSRKTNAFSRLRLISMVAMAGDHMFTSSLFVSLVSGLSIHDKGNVSSRE